MPSERAFLRQRLALVEQWLANPDREFIYAGKGRARRRTQPSTHRDITHEREARLLHQLEEYLEAAQAGRRLKEVRKEALVAGFTEAYNYTFCHKSIILLAGIMLQYHSETHLRSPTQHDTAICKIGHPDAPHLSPTRMRIAYCATTSTFW
jgi:hypothetical protein